MLTESETIMYRRMSDLHYGLRKTLDRINTMLHSDALSYGQVEQSLLEIKRDIEELISV